MALQPDPEHTIRKGIENTGPDKGVRDALIGPASVASNAILELLKKEGINEEPVRETLAIGLEADYAQLETLRKTHLDFSQVIENIIEASELHRNLLQLNQDIAQCEQRKIEIQGALQQEQTRLQDVSTRETALTANLAHLSQVLEQLNQTIQRATEERAQKLKEQQEKNRQMDTLLIAIVDEALGTATQLSSNDRTILENYIQKKNGADDGLTALAQRSRVVKQLVTLKLLEAARDASTLVRNKYNPLLSVLKEALSDLDSRLQENNRQKEDKVGDQQETQKGLAGIEQGRIQGEQDRTRLTNELATVGTTIGQKVATVEENTNGEQRWREALRGGIGYQLTDTQQEKLVTLFHKTLPEHAATLIQSLFDLLREAEVPEGAMVTLRVPITVSFSFKKATMDNRDVLSKIQKALGQTSKPHVEAYHPRHMEAYIHSEAQLAPGGTVHAMLVTGEAKEWHVAIPYNSNSIPFGQCIYIWYEAPTTKKD